MPSSVTTTTPDLSIATAELLDEAARVIENYGWYQYDHWINSECGKPWLGTGVCAIGGLLIAAGVTRAEGSAPAPVIRAVEAAQIYLSRQYGPCNLAGYNDVVASRADQVTDVLRGAAKALRDGEIAAPEIEWEKL